MVEKGRTRSLTTGYWKGVVLASLTMLAIGQSVVVGRRAPRLDPSVGVGDDLSDLVIRDSSGEMIALGAGQETLLLVFDPDCAHSARVADAWASWLADDDSRRPRTIAVSPGPLGAAVRYARDSQWSVRVGSVESYEHRADEHTLTARTPWVFAIGDDGRVVAEGHGVRFAEVTQTIGHRTGGSQDGYGTIRER